MSNWIPGVGVLPGSLRLSLVRSLGSKKNSSGMAQVNTGLGKEASFTSLGSWPSGQAKRRAGQCVTQPSSVLAPCPLCRHALCCYDRLLPRLASRLPQGCRDSKWLLSLEEAQMWGPSGYRAPASLLQRSISRVSPGFISPYLLLQGTLGSTEGDRVEPAKLDAFPTSHCTLPQVEGDDSPVIPPISGTYQSGRYEGSTCLLHGCSKRWKVRAVVGGVSADGLPGVEQAWGWRSPGGKSPRVL